MGNTHSRDSNDLRQRKNKCANASRSDLLPPSYSEAVEFTSPNGFLTVDKKLEHLDYQDHWDSPLPPFRRRASSFGGVTSPVADQSNSQTDRKGGQKWTSEAEKLEYLRKPLRQESYEDALEILRQYNTIIVVDDSLSMEGSRWSEARMALAALAEAAAQYDTDGIDVCFLNSPKQGSNMKSAEFVQRLFDSVIPHGCTPIGRKLNYLLRNYINSLHAARKKYGSEDSIKPVNYIVITDGEPSDEPADVIINACRRLDKYDYLLTQVGIQFVQIGNDPHATKFLRELDDDLGTNASVRDIVDTTPYLGGELTAEVMIKILIGGINRRVDRRGAKRVMRDQL